MMHAFPVVDLAPTDWPGNVADQPESSPHASPAREDMSILVTIGILAHNEERSLARTIASLFAQSLLSGEASIPRLTVEVVVAPNGCTDATAAIAERALATAAPSGVGYRVVSLPRPGKSAAWNDLIHRIADPATDIFVMMDADIEFATPRTIENSIAHLLANPKAGVVVDLPVNDLVRKSSTNLLERVLVRLSSQKAGNAPGVAGSFYCARGATLQAIRMPHGLPVEDGFLAAAIMTNGFRDPPDRSRIERAADAAHYYEGLNTIRAILRHEVRLVIGSALNSYLCWDVLHFLTDPNGPGFGDLIGRLNAASPDWYERMMANTIANRGRWALPRGTIGGAAWSRFRILSRLPRAQALALSPILLAAFALDLAVLCAANRQLRQGRAVHHW